MFCTACLAAFAVAVPARAATVPVSAVNWNLAMNDLGLYAQLSNDCIVPSAEGRAWIEHDAKRPFRYTKVFEGATEVKGSFDTAASGGSMAGVAAFDLRFDQFNRGAGAFRVSGLGLRASKGRFTVTGRVARTRTLFARFGPLKPLLQVKRPTSESGPFLRKGIPVPDTFVVAMDGNATVLPALAREFNRIRCRGQRYTQSRAIRPGARFGVVQAQLRPDAAAGVGGYVELAVRRLVSADGSIAFAPAGTARAATKALRFDLPAGQRTPLACTAGYGCHPVAGTQLPLGNAGFTLSQHGRTVTFTGLTAIWADDHAGGVTPVLSATLDGTPGVVIGGPDDNFEDRVQTALGVTDLIYALDLGAHFAKTAAP